MTQQIELANQKRAAGEKLFAGGLVVRRRATHGRSDVSIGQLQAVFTRDAMRLIRESSFPERAIEELAGAIASKHAAGTIGAVRARGEPDDYKARKRIAETGHRPAPILLSAIGAPLHAADLFAMRHQTRASKAMDDFVV